VLPPKHRLKSKDAIKNVLRKGRVATRGSFLQVKLIASNRKVSRFAFIAGARTAKKAVVRNTIKRRLRAVTTRQLNNLKKGFDCVVLAGPEVKDKSFDEIEVELTSLFKQSGLL